MPELTVVDTSCLIALTRINYLSLLHQVYGRVVITPEIKQEFKFELPDWVEVRYTSSDEDLTVLNSLVDLGGSISHKILFEEQRLFTNYR